MSGRPSAPRPDVPSPLIRSPLNVLAPTRTQGPGALPTPGVAPLRSSRRGRAVAAGVGMLCASVGRWGSPADVPVAHGCLHLRHPLALQPPTAAFAGAPGSGPL
jgi:hypothetical protein